MVPIKQKISALIGNVQQFVHTHTVCEMAHFKKQRDPPGFKSI